MSTYAGAVAYLAPLVLNQDPKLKRQVCCALAQIAKHSVDMAEVVVEAEVFPKILTCLKFPDELVREHAATVVREVSHILSSSRPGLMLLDLSACMLAMVSFNWLGAVAVRWESLLLIVHKHAATTVGRKT